MRASNERVPLVIFAFIGTFGCTMTSVAQRGAAEPAPVMPPSCTAELLASTPPYDQSRFGQLIGHYRWTNIDTVSTRRAISPADYEQMKRGQLLRSEFRLWPTDSAFRIAIPFRSGLGGRAAVGPLSGALVHGDTAGFSPDHPQIEVTSEARPYLEILYDPRVGRSLLDGGHVMELLPVQVLGDWGFGGYYDTRGDLIGERDRDGKVIPSFAGFYCAFRLSP
jgi:hypothetical protein